MAAASAGVACRSSMLAMPTSAERPTEPDLGNFRNGSNGRVRCLLKSSANDRYLRTTALDHRQTNVGLPHSRPTEPGTNRQIVLAGYNSRSVNRPPHGREKS